MANSEQNWLSGHIPLSPSATTPMLSKGPQTPSTPHTPFTLTPGLSLQLSPVGSAPVFSLTASLSEDQGKDIERETDELFRVNTVDKIKEIEREKRLDINRRKEDLRQMVGERYRDLIDAADSIMHMKKCSEQARSSVTVMEQLCQKLQQTHFLRGSGGLRGPPSKSDSHAVAAQMKLLADSPEKIWVCLEKQNYLPAAHHYLLARHIFSQLSLKLGIGNNRNFTVVQRLWHSVACFKDNILQCCNCHIQCPDIQEDHMLQSLCAILLLEGCSPRQAFAQTLLARKAAIQSVFATTHGQGHRSVKSQVCQLARTIVQSLTNISKIFCTRQGQESLSLLVQRIGQFKNMKKQEGVIPASLADRLPDSITGFAPAISSTSLMEVPPDDIHSSTEDWVTMCVSDVCSGMNGVLQHITTFKALAGIREAVHTLLSQRPSAVGEGGKSDDDVYVAEAKEEWASVCANVLGRDFCVWGTFLKPLFLQRAKSIVDKQFGKAGANAGGLLDKLTSAPQGTHGSADLWEEEHGGLGLISGGDGTDINPLSLKAKACSPSVFSFCQSFDQELNGLIEDITFYLGEPEKKGHTMEEYWKQQKIGNVTSFPFTLTGDSSLLQEHVQRTTVECIARFLKNIGSKVVDIQQELSTNKHAQPSMPINRLILMGRLCHCLMDCCPSFSFLAHGCKLQGTPSARPFSKSHKRQKKEEEKKQSAEEILQEKATSIFKIWSQWCTSEIIVQLQDQLSAEMELNSLSSTLAWDEITISEESESGEKVSSVIKVPSQASVYVTSLLFALCQEISRVGGHALDRSLLEDLSGSLLAGVLDSYEKLLRDSTSGGKQKLMVAIPQSCALQLLFNLKFFSSILVHPSTKEEFDSEARMKQLVECLQSYVDPFDLDVFMPYILSNLERQLTRSSVLLGILLSVKGTPIASSFYKNMPSSSSQEKHIVIPLASSVSRLPTLPMTLPHAIGNNNQSVQNVDTSFSSSSLLQTISFFHHL